MYTLYSRHKRLHAYACMHARASATCVHLNFCETPHVCVCMYIYIYSYTSTYTHTHQPYMQSCMHTIHTYIHACMHACMHTCIHTYMCMFFACICMYVCVYVCMYVCIYIYTHISLASVHPDVYTSRFWRSDKACLAVAGLSRFPFGVIIVFIPWVSSFLLR